MPPLNCPMLLMEIMHPNTSYTPWIRTVLPCSCTAAGDATCAHAGVRNTSRPSTAAALLGQAPRARILTPRLRGCLWYSWCPNLAPSPSGSMAKALPGIPKSGFSLGGQELGGGGVTPIGRACQHCTAGSGAMEGQRERRGQSKAEGLIPGAAAISGAAEEEPVPVLSEHSGCYAWVQGTWRGQGGPR